MKPVDLWRGRQQGLVKLRGCACAGDQSLSNPSTAATASVCRVRPVLAG